MQEPFADISFRPENAEDEGLLLELYSSTRGEELEAVNWPPEMRAPFLAMQFRAQRQGYRSGFPHAQFLVILQAGRPIGRMVVDRSEKEIRLVDVVLQSSHRNAGLGTALVQGLIAEARAARKPLRLDVHRGSRATRLYERLGFARTIEHGLHQEMEWSPDT